MARIPTKAREQEKAGKMIKAILVFNNQGKPRLTKFFVHYVSIQLASFPSLLGTRLVFNHERYVAEGFNSGIHNFARSLLGLAEIVWLLDVYPAYIIVLTLHDNSGYLAWCKGV